MKVIDLLNKIANGELKENTRFYDKYVHKEYIFKPKSYAGIYPENKVLSEENWYLTLRSGSFRLMEEIEIIEDIPKEDKKIEKLDLEFDNCVIKEHLIGGNISYLSQYKALKMIYEKQCEIIDKINKGEK